MTGDSEEALEVSNRLIAAGASQSFTESMANRFIDLIAVSVGATVSQMSFLSAAKSLSSNLLQIPFGRLSDRYGKRRFIATGRILNGLVLVAMLYINEPTLFIYIVIGFSILNSLAITPWRSLLGDYASESTRGETIGRLNSATGMGGIAAMVVALIINLNQTGETTTVEEKPPHGSGESIHWGEISRDKRLIRYILLNFVYGVSMSFSWPFYPFIMTKKLGIKLWQVAILSLLSNVISNVFQRYVSSVMDRIGRRPVIVLSRVIMAAAPFAYAFATSWTHIALAEGFMGIGIGAWMSSEPTYIIDIAPGELRATYMAASMTSFGLAAFTGSLISGYVANNFFTGELKGIEMGLIISGVLRLITGLLYMLAYESRPKRKETELSP
jgi:MFS family permease